MRVLIPWETRAEAVALLSTARRPAGRLGVVPPDTVRQVGGVGLRAIRVAARMVGPLIVGGVQVSVALAWAWAETCRALRTLRRPDGAAVSAATPGRGCVWCGYGHTRHAVRVHSDEVALRLSERITA